MPQQSWRCSKLSASSNVHAHFTPTHPWLPQGKTAEVIVVENGEAYSHDVTAPSPKGDGFPGHAD